MVWETIRINLGRCTLNSGGGASDPSGLRPSFGTGRGRPGSLVARMVGAMALAHWELLLVDWRSCCAAMRSVPGIRLSIWWLIVAICGGLVGTVAMAGDDEYLPLNEGDEWTMDAVVEGGDGKKRTATLRRRVGEQVERGGKVYRTVRSWSDNGFEERKLMRKMRREFIRSR